MAALASVSAFAQSSVSITGILSVGQATDTAGATSYGGWKGDRNVLNISAIEDLGNGQKASVFLQNRFNPVSGGVSASGYVSSTDGSNSGLNFEQTKFNFADSTYGEIAVGRFTNAIGVAPLHPFEDAAVTTSSHQAVNGRLSGQFQYTSPAFMGFQVWGLNAQKSANKYMASGTGGGYNSTADLTSVTGGEKNFGAYGVNYSNGPIYAQALSYNDLIGTRASKVGVSYDLGSNLYGVKVFANQFNQKNDMNLAGASTITAATGAAGTALASNVGMAAHKATELAATMPYGKFTFMAGRLTTNTGVQLGALDTTKVSKNAWGTTYSLSKLTSLQYYASTTKDAGYTSGVLANTGFAPGRRQWIGVQTGF